MPDPVDPAGEDPFRNGAHSTKDAPSPARFAAWRSAFVRNAEIDAVLVVAVGFLVAVALLDVFGPTVALAVLGAATALAAGIVVRQVVLDRHRDRFGRRPAHPLHEGPAGKGHR